MHLCIYAFMRVCIDFNFGLLHCENRQRECIYKMIHTFGALFGTPKSKNARAFEWVVEINNVLGARNPAEHC